MVLKELIEKVSIFAKNLDKTALVTLSELLNKLVSQANLPAFYIPLLRFLQTFSIRCSTNHFLEKFSPTQVKHWPSKTFENTDWLWLHRNCSYSSDRTNKKICELPDLNNPEISLEKNHPSKNFNLEGGFIKTLLF